MESVFTDDLNADIFLSSYLTIENERSNIPRLCFDRRQVFIIFRIKSEG